MHVPKVKPRPVSYQHKQQACCLLQVSFIPANKLDQAAKQKPAQSGPSSDQQNGSRQHTDRQPQSGGADSPHSDNKRKRDSHKDRAADADSKRHHSRSDLSASLSVSTDTGTDTLAKMTEDIKTAK